MRRVVTKRLGADLFQNSGAKVGMQAHVHGRALCLPQLGQHRHACPGKLGPGSSGAANPLILYQLHQPAFSLICIPHTHTYSRGAFD